MKRLLFICSLILAFSSCKRGDPTPDVPQNPIMISSTETSITWSWDAVKGAQSYEMQLKDEDDVVRSAGTTACQYEFKGLKEGATYTFAVRAISFGLYSEWSQEVKGCTQ